VRAFVEPEQAARAWVAAVIAGDLRAHVPDLVFTETANALAGYVRAGRLGYDDCDEALGTVLSLPFDVVPGRLLARQALAFTVTRRVSAYDACYLALTIGLDAVLVTADRRLAAEAEKAALLPRDYPPTG
jgi:predicted nucleic acid-binding protein